MAADKEIIELFFQRSEDALTEIQTKYGLLCRKIAYGILKSNEDTEECLNSSYMKIWKSIPPTRPKSLCAYLCAIVRNGAFEIYSKNSRRNADISLEELEWLINDEATVDRMENGIELGEILNAFLESSKPENRKLFMARYYYNMSISEIAQRFNMSESAVKTRLSRIRSNLQKYLSERGVVYE